MREPEITLELALELGLSETEFSTITGALGRVPTYTELRILATYWSEPCSGKSSNAILNLLPQNDSNGQTGGKKNFSQQIDIGNDSVLVFNTSSRYITKRLNRESVAQSCTIQAIRDITATGARLTSVFYSRCVGLLENRGTKKEIKDLAKGVVLCGKNLEFQTAASNLVFDDFNDNFSIFNSMAVGAVSANSLVKSVAHGEGNPVFVLRRKNEIKNDKELLDLSLEKSLGCICQELSQRSYLIGIQAISRGGVAISCIDLAVNGNCGITLYLNRIRSPEKFSFPADDLLSEAFGHYLIVINQGFEKELRAICRKSDVDCLEIGEVNGDGVISISFRKKQYCSIPLTVFLKRMETPIYKLTTTEPSYLAEVNKPKSISQKKIRSWNSILLSLLETPNVLASEKIRSTLDLLDTKWNSLWEGELDQGVVFRTWSAGRYSYLDPRMGGRCAIVGAARKVVCRGASPKAALTSVLMGDLEDPEAYYLFKEMIEGMAEVCREFQISVVSKDINSESGVSIPTPVVGVVGLIDDARRILSPEFKNANDFIIMLGSHRGELGGSEYQRIVYQSLEGPPPVVDISMEGRVHEIILMLHKVGLIKSACDVSIGGLAVALSHCLIASKERLGARIHMSSKIREDELLFGETQGLFLITIDEDSLIEIERLCMRIGVSCTAIGRVTDDGIFSFNKWIKVKVDKLKKLHIQNLRKFPLF